MSVRKVFKAHQKEASERCLIVIVIGTQRDGGTEQEYRTMRRDMFRTEPTWTLSMDS